MPATSEAQRRAMYAAAEGHSTLGIPQSVGKEFVGDEAAQPDAPAPYVAPIVPKAGPAGRAAGIIFSNTDGEILVMHRGDGGDFPRTWGLPGGHQETDESLEECARREAFEETGFSYEGPLKQVYDDGQFCTYAASIDAKFPVTLCDESTGYSWTRADDLPQPAHPGLAPALRILAADTELAVAELIRDGLVPSPQYYSNMLLLNMRITGTGVAYRSKDEEFVFRDPQFYLNDEFLRRCNGLSVIIDHPDKGTLNSDEFVARIAGAVMLAYIKGDEVWAIARIYDEEAIKIICAAIEKDDISTSPGVTLGATEDNPKIMIEGGKPLLIEGKPVLLDHIAIVSKSHGGLGVWDKGGPASGLDLTNGVLAMPEEKKDDDNKADAHKADAHEPLNKVLAAMDSLATRMDSMQKRMDDDDARRADAAKKADDDAKAKADAEEKEAKEKADAAEAEEKAKADAAKKDDDSEMEGETVADEHAKADSLFATLGSAAPRPLNGEKRGSYIRRVVNKLKEHSPTWKSVDLSAIKDDAAFGIVRTQVYADAAKAAKNPATFSASPGLREIKTPDRAGRMISTFHGSPNDWMAPFMASARRVTSINKDA